MDTADLVCHEELDETPVAFGGEAVEGEAVGGETPVVNTVNIYYTTLNLTLHKFPLENFTPPQVPVEPTRCLIQRETCGSFEFQIAYAAVVGQSVDFISKSYRERILNNRELANIRSNGVQRILAISGGFKCGTLTSATAVQYLDVLLSKYDESRVLEAGFIKLWTVVCFRMARKMVDGTDLSLSSWAMDGSVQANLNLRELLLAEILEWNFCIPTVYTFFHYLINKMNLKFRGEEMTRVKADGFVLQSLEDHHLLQFHSHEVAAALALSLCTFPDNNIQQVYESANKDNVAGCVDLLCEKLQRFGNVP